MLVKFMFESYLRVGQFADRKHVLSTKIFSCFDQHFLTFEHFWQNFQN